jgi:hypothetical protein
MASGGQSKFCNLTINDVIISEDEEVTRKMMTSLDETEKSGGGRNMKKVCDRNNKNAAWR